MAGRPKGVMADADKLAVVFLLKANCHWSSRRVGELFGRHHDTVSAWYHEACKRPRAYWLAILAEGEATRARIHSVGDTAIT